MIGVVDSFGDHDRYSPVTYHCPNELLDVVSVVCDHNHDNHNHAYLNKNIMRCLFLNHRDDGDDDDGDDDDA